MHSSDHIYHHQDTELHGFVAHDGATSAPRPAVLVIHDWSGRNEFACNKATLLAKMGYIGFAVDMYGQKRTGTTNEEKTALMNPLANDRALLRQRIRAAFDAVSALPEVDKNRIAVMGFCFGGLCALDLARSGADLKGAISFHGLLSKPEHLKSETIKAKVLALHGYDDPLVKTEQLHAFCQEMTEAKVDWQVQIYGNVQHSFTNPHAHDLDIGLVYNEQAAKRSWIALTDFLQEIF